MLKCSSLNCPVDFCPGPENLRDTEISWSRENFDTFKKNRGCRIRTQKSKNELRGKP